MTRDAAWLADSLEALDRVVFMGALSEIGVRAKWMRHRIRKHTFVYGIYDIDRKRIELSPVLKHDWVPEGVALSVLAHEALHAILGPEHSHEFRLAEARFPHHHASELWCAQNLDRLLGESPPAKEHS